MIAFDHTVMAILFDYAPSRHADASADVREAVFNLPRRLATREAKRREHNLSYLSVA